MPNVLVIQGMKIKITMRDGIREDSDNIKH